MLNRLINTKVAGGGGCTDIVDNYDPFGGNGVALYQLNGDATDESGNYNGTASNVTYGTGVFSQAGVFNGSSSKIINASSLVTGNSDRTLSAWMKTSNTANTMVLAGLGSETGANNNQWAIGFLDGTNDTVRIYGYGGANEVAWASLGVNVRDGQWHHIAVSWNGSQLSWFVDGSNVLIQPFSHTYATSSGVQIGKWSEGNYWSGDIDQVRVFNTALTPLEVEALYTEELCICDGTVDTLDILGDGSCIATYQLDGNANDLSGNYSGTPTNVSYGVGEFDLAGVFNGSSSQIVLPNSTQGIGDTTSSFSFWVKPNSLGSGYGLVCLFTQNDWIEIRYNSSNEFVIYPARQSNDTYIGFSPVVRTPNQWYNIVITRDSSSPNIKLYIDGSLIETNTTWDGTLTTANNPNTIGANSAGSSLYFNGSIDQVRIFNKALSAGEVTTLYNETACTPPIVENCFDVTSLVYLGKNDSGSIKTTLGAIGTTWARGMKFSPDGSILFIKSWRDGSGFNDIISGLDLSIPYDITTFSYSSNNYNFGAVSNGRDFEFNPSGTKIFNIQGTTITEHSLSIPFDLTTTSAAINTYALNSADIGSEVYVIQFNADGTKMLASGSNNKILEYNLGTPYSLATVTYVQQSTVLNEPIPNAIIHIKFTPDGTRILAKRTDGQIVVRDFSTPFDVSTMSSIVATNSGSPMGISYDCIAYNPEGTIVVGFNADTLYSLNMCY